MDVLEVEVELVVELACRRSPSTARTRSFEYCIRHWLSYSTIMSYAFSAISWNRARLSRSSCAGLVRLGHVAAHDQHVALAVLGRERRQRRLGPARLGPRFRTRNEIRLGSPLANACAKLASTAR